MKCLIVDDNKMARMAMKQLVNQVKDLELVKECADAMEAYNIINKETIDLLLLDIEMPGMTGLELAAAVNEERKRSGLPTRVVILTTFARAGYLRRALDAGVSGYLLKDAPASQLAEALRRVAQGGRAIDPELAAEAWGEDDPLTDRERQVLRHAGEGASTAAIAERLGLSEGTVRNYLSEAISKLNAGNRVEAARLAREKGWL